MQINVAPLKVRNFGGDFCYAVCDRHVKAFLKKIHKMNFCMSTLENGFFLVEVGAFGLFLGSENGF